MFVLGAKGRSGTGFLRELVRLHPDCAGPAHPLSREDWLLFYAQPLADYARALSERIGGARFEPLDVTGFEDGVLEALGRGLLSYGGGDYGDASHVVLRAPSVRGIEHAHRLFPDAKVLVIIRNGRDSVESSLRSWPTEKDGTETPFEEFVRRWEQGARRLLRLMEEYPGRMMSVRYEDLVVDLERRMRRVLRFVGLDPARYDFDAAAELPVHGSSSFGLVDGHLTWQPQRRTEAFRPLERAAGWDADRHRRFNAIAGDMMEAFGYPLERPA